MSVVHGGEDSMEHRVEANVGVLYKRMWVTFETLSYVDLFGMYSMMYLT